MSIELLENWCQLGPHNFKINSEKFTQLELRLICYGGFLKNALKMIENLHKN